MAGYKIKISAPKQNPHICYISTEYRDKISELKRATGKTFYSLLCTCANHKLDTVENIKKFKSKLKKRGFKTIGEWAENLIELLYENIENIQNMDLNSVNITLVNKED